MLNKSSLKDRVQIVLLSIGKFIYRFLAWVAFLSIAPVILLSLLPLILWRFVIISVNRMLSRGVFHEQLSFFDTVFALDNFYTNPYASNVKYFVLEGKVSLEEVKHQFCQRILYKRIASDGKERWKFQRLHQVPYRFGWMYFWKDIVLNIELHIRESIILTEDLKENKLASESDLCTFLGNLMTNPFPNQSALWEVVVVNNYLREQSVVILRLHHVIADGYSFNAIVDEMISKKSQYLVQEQEFALKKKLYLLWTAPAWTISFFLEEMFQLNWMHRRKKSSTATGVLAVTSIPLEDIKSIRRKTNCHFATIGLSLLGGAIQRLFLNTHSKQDVPECIKIMHLLPKPHHPFDRMCNHWSAGTFKISLKATNALERLNEAEAYFQHFTGNHYNELLEFQSRIGSLMPSPLYSLALSRNYLTNMAFTSLPGYDGPAQFCGINITDMYKVCGLQYKQTAVGAAAYSHNGQLAFSIFANRDIVPSQECAQSLVRVYLHEELQQLKDILQLDTANV